MNRKISDDKDTDPASYWDLLLQDATDVVMRVNFDLGIVYCSKQIENYGLKREKITGNSYRLLGLGQQEEKVWKDTLRTVAVTKKPGRMLFGIPTSTGGTVRFDCSVGPVIDDTGNPTEFVIIMRECGHNDRLIHKEDAWSMHRNFIIGLHSEIVSRGGISKKVIVSHILKRLGEFLAVDRVYIFDYNHNAGSINNSYEWCAEGIHPEIDNLQDVPIAMIPDWAEAHIAGMPYTVSDVKTLPVDSFARQVLDAQQIKSLTTYPLLDQNRFCLGFVGCDAVKKHRHFAKEDVEMLGIVADLLISLYQLQNVDSVAVNPFAPDHERMLHKENAALKQLNKELKDFAYMASHNLMAPLNNILGLVDCLEKEVSNSEKALSYISQVKQSMVRIRCNFEGMKEVLLVTDGQPLIKSQVRFEKVYSDTFSLLQGQIRESKIAITTNWQVDRIEYCQSHIENFFINLISNAMRYASPDRAPNLHIETSHAEGYTCITFADNGVGIDLKKHGKDLFGLYKRFHNHPESRGLGLYLVKAQIERLGGRIEVESKKNKGTTFRLHLLNG